MSTPPPSLPEHAETFLHEVYDRPHTEATYRSALINLQKFAVAAGLAKPNLPLAPSAIRPALLSDYYAWLRKVTTPRGTRLSNATLRLYLTVAGGYLRWLEAERQLPPDVREAELQALLEKRTGHGLRRLPPNRRGSDDAIGVLLAYYRAQLDACPFDHSHPRARLILLRNHAMLQTLYATAGRAAEVVSLARADVAEGRATQVEITGKGGKKRMLILTRPAQEAIQSYLHARDDRFTGLFISHGAYAGGRLSTHSLWRIVNDAAKAVFGVNAKGEPKKRVGPHSFRHLRAQHLSDEGMPITSLQTMLGHASIATTRDTYAPKTLSEQLVDEIATYGRNPDEVVRVGRTLVKDGPLGASS